MLFTYVFAGERKRERDLSVFGRKRLCFGGPYFLKYGVKGNLNES